MKCQEFINLLEQSYPKALAEDWDNPGLQAGRSDREVKRVYIALDATDQVIGEAISWKADFLLTHHPLLMSPIRQINTDTFIGRRLIRLIQHDICCYAMHTNHDVVTMGPLAGRMLQLSDTRVLEITKSSEFTGKEEGIGRVGVLPRPMTLKECGDFVKQIFGLEWVKMFGCPDSEVHFAAVSPGSGKSMIRPAVESGADVLITGDIGHHEGIDALARKLNVIDAGHYGLEHIFIGQMAEFLKKAACELEIRQEQIVSPFQIL